MKKFIVFLFLTFYLGSFLQAQIIQAESTTDGIPAKEIQQNPWRLGGSFGMGGGSDNSFSFNFSPKIGYMVNKKMETGLSLGYIYNKYKESKFNVFSAGIYTNYSVLPELLIGAHFETLNGKEELNKKSYNFREEALWLGAGYRTIGDVSFTAGIMYNVLYRKDDSIYSSPLRPFGGITISF